MSKVFTLILLLALSNCAKKESHIASDLEESQVSETGFYSPENNTHISNQKEDYLRSRIGYNFLVEQFTVKIFSSMLNAIKQHPPAGIIYWNPDNVDSEDLIKVNYAYAEAAAKSNLNPLLFSTDYEGGGISTTVFRKNIPGIQRFTKGFSLLLHPSWLGYAYNRDQGNLCYLHGQIMAKELSYVGINYPLTSVSDLAKNLFSIRGISKNPQIISQCINLMVKAFDENKNMIFVTKHFPGLGDTKGDTHEGTVISKAENLAQLESSIAPFQNEIKFSATLKNPLTYAILASHAMYKPLDSENITTVSSKILVDFLRKQLNYQNAVLSDAMWMGEYGHLPFNKIKYVYLKSIISGMDILMIPGQHFASSINFMRSVYDNKLSTTEISEIESYFGENITSVREKYIQRLRESVARVEKLKSTLTPYNETIEIKNIVEPKTLTEKIYSQYISYYHQLTQ